MLIQTSELRKTPEQKQEEKRAKASASLNDWVNRTNLAEVKVVTKNPDGSNGKILTLEQINNFEF